jgi:hypothetical protein
VKPAHHFADVYLWLKVCVQILLIIYKNNLSKGLGKIDIKHKYAVSRK